MENTIETPTQMTTGISQNISAQTTSFGKETNTGLKNDISVGIFEEQTSHSEFISESQEIPDQVRDDDKPSSESVELLLQSAKEDGFEEALVKLSNGEFDEAEVDDAVVEKVPEIPEEEVLLYEQISTLEDKIASLEEANSQLTERITNLETVNQVSLETLLQLALMLQKLAEEKDKNEKTGMLEVLINFLVFFMKETFVPKDENEKTSSKGKIEPKENTNVSSERLLEVLRMFRNGSESKSSKTPHIENNAA